MIARVEADPQTAQALRDVRLFDRFGSLRAASRSREVGAAVARSELDRYAAALRSLYRAISEVSGASVLIDSSKYAPYAAVLHERAGIPVHLVHIVRDPRGNAHSWSRVKTYETRGGVEIPMRRHSTAGSVLRWALHHRLSLGLADRVTTYVRVRYEDLCADPERSFEIISSAVGLELPAGVIAEDGVMRLEPTHQVAGNPRKRGRDVRLEIDDAWRRERSSVWRMAVALPIAPLMYRLGYHPWAGSSR